MGTSQNFLLAFLYYVYNNLISEGGKSAFLDFCILVKILDRLNLTYHT